MGLQDFGVIMNYLQIFFTNKWHKKTCPQEVQLAFGIVLKKVAELLYIKFYVIFAALRQIIKRKKQDKRPHLNLIKEDKDRDNTRNIIVTLYCKKYTFFL